MHDCTVKRSDDGFQIAEDQNSLRFDPRRARASPRCWEGGDTLRVYLRTGYKLRCVASMDLKARRKPYLT